jgi:hypothetical protein
LEVAVPGGYGRVLLAATAGVPGTSDGRRSVIRRYCDICETQIGRSYVSDRFKPSVYRAGANWAAEIIVRNGNTWNQGDLCLDCLKEIVAEGREYPRQAPRLTGSALEGDSNA